MHFSNLFMCITNSLSNLWCFLTTYILLFRSLYSFCGSFILCCLNLFNWMFWVVFFEFSFLGKCYLLFTIQRGELIIAPKRHFAWEIIQTPKNLEEKKLQFFYNSYVVSYFYYLKTSSISASFTLTILSKVIINKNSVFSRSWSVHFFLFCLEDIKPSSVNMHTNSLRVFPSYLQELPSWPEK